MLSKLKSRSEPGGSRIYFCRGILLTSFFCMPAFRDGNDGTMRDTATAELVRLGAGIQRASTGTTSPVTSVVLIGARDTDIACKQVAVLDTLENVEFCSCDVTDQGIARLQRLHRLKYLGLSGTLITDAGLASLKSLKGLRYLDLSNTGLTGAGLARINDLHELWLLDLSRTKVVGAGLLHLRGLTGLRVLNLSNTGLGESEIANLATTNPKILELALSGTQVTNAGLDQLCQRLKLRSISIDATRITDSGLTCLRRSDALRTVAADKSQLTGTGLRALRAIPHLESVFPVDSRITDRDIEMYKRQLPGILIGSLPAELPPSPVPPAP